MPYKKLRVCYVHCSSFCAEIPDTYTNSDVKTGTRVPFLKYSMAACRKSTSLRQTPRTTKIDKIGYPLYRTRTLNPLFVEELLVVQCCEVRSRCSRESLPKVTYLLLRDGSDDLRFVERGKPAWPPCRDSVGCPWIPAQALLRVYRVLRPLQLLRVRPPMGLICGKYHASPPLCPFSLSFSGLA